MISLSTLATCNFGNFQFWQLANLATCNFGNLQFWQLIIWQFSILTTFSFDNFQFWLFSSKIFELIQEQQEAEEEEHIDCMDLAIKKGQVLVILMPGMIQPSQSVMFLMKWGCKGHWGHGGCWGCRGHWGCKGSKVWKITTEDLRVIQVFEFSFILMFWKNIDLLDSWNIILKFTTFFVGPGCWGQLMLLFRKLVDETQMPTIPEATSHHSSRKF